MGDQRDAGGPEARVDRRPGIWPRNSGANSPCTVETCTPTFSNTRPRIIDMMPPPPGSPLWSLPLPGLALESPRRGLRGGQEAGTLVLERLEGRADPVAQVRECQAGRLFGQVDVGGGEAFGPCKGSS